MAEALQLAGRGLTTTTPNPRVGCVLVRDGVVVGRGFHVRAGEPHAEVHALQAAGELARGATAYVTLEPCAHQGRTPPCADALIAAGVTRVVMAVGDSNPQVGGQGAARLRAAGIDVSVGLMADAATALNAGFLRRMAGGWPWLTAKVAASMDGRTAMASGESKWITGSAARADVQLGRARSCAILTGIGTVLADDPLLNVRLPDVTRQPLRVILDRQLRLPLQARLFTVPGDVAVITDTAQATSPDAAAWRDRGVRVAGVPTVDGQLHWPALLATLADWSLNEVWLEAGATLTGSALAAGVLDALWLYQAPVFLGATGRPVVDTAWSQLIDCPRWSLQQVRQLGDDVCFHMRPMKRESDHVHRHH